MVMFNVDSVCIHRLISAEPEPADEDNMEEIDTENIISNSRRTRGKTVDYVKAAQETPEEDADEDEDEDFEDPGDEMKD